MYLDPFGYIEESPLHPLYFYFIFLFNLRSWCSLFIWGLLGLYRHCQLYWTQFLGLLSTFQLFLLNLVPPVAAVFYCCFQDWSHSCPLLVWAIVADQLGRVHDCLSCSNLNLDCKELGIYIYILLFLNFLIEWELPAVTALSWLHFLGFFYKVSFGSFCSIVFLLLRGNHNFFVRTNYTMPHVISVF